MLDRGWVAGPGVLPDPALPIAVQGTIAPFPPGPFSIVYCDPPWQFATRSAKGKGRSPEQHYRCMTLEDIKSLPVQSIAARDCTLFLWGTWPCLPQVLEVIDAWGFRFKSCAFDWAKRTKTDTKYHMGCGYWTRANTEYCLLATKGKPKRVSAAVRQLIVAPVGRHSAKPPETRDRIVQLLGDLPRIELFARDQTPGWTSWGNEVPDSQVPRQGEV